jgi:hypothetical protein
VRLLHKLLSDVCAAFVLRAHAPSKVFLFFLTAHHSTGGAMYAAAVISGLVGVALFVVGLVLFTQNAGNGDM